MMSKHQKIPFSLAFISITVAYYLTAKFGLSLAFVHSSVSSVWPPTGFAIAALYIFGTRIWPAVFLGAFTINLETFLTGNYALGTSSIVAFFIALGNTFEAVVAIQGLRLFIGNSNPLHTTRGVRCFFVIGALFAPMLSATIGVTSLCIFAIAEWRIFFELWLTWFLGDVGGAATVAPLMICLSETKWKSTFIHTTKIIEIMAFFVCLFFVGGAIFLGRFPVEFQQYFLAYLSIPPVLWGVFRFKEVGAVLSVIVIVSFAVWGTINHNGPFSKGFVPESLLLLETFTFIISLTALLISALRNTEQNLMRTNEDLEKCVQQRTAELTKTNELLQRQIEERDIAQQELWKYKELLEERIRERTQNLEIANKEIKTFVYIVSHDLQTPLINIKGFAGELRYCIDDLREIIHTVKKHCSVEHQKKLQKIFSEDIPESLDFIETSVVKINNLTQAVLKLSRLGRKELCFETIDVNTVVQSSLKSLAFQIEQKNVQVMIDSLPCVVVDEIAMQQIFDNILTNAIIYLDTTRQGIVKIGSKKENNRTLFFVEDNGRGISEEDQGKIFDTFQRCGPQDVPGEGMGLAYVRSLVRRHGGEIYCRSQLGKGSTFSFFISPNTDEV
ncbi:MASE1 domain-containing protein [Candidatus Uabimicrobium amorphum]|uniref:histidine kinase n=1 Tax=Uabimicrobium amorphum TaxID=2596890 RepID=A0A5S9F251_UABAM|nr:MASE1 domain-containing protein [Candidatus Uabimicrobium amorphum]BBM82024.1 histidine kinase [Candidatus Uabimicrobium amorphum]